MARPVRNLWKIRTVVRRRHRTWMASMCLATVGWGSFWVAAVWIRFAPESAPSFASVCWFSSVFAAFGLAAAVFTIRAKLAWILVTAVPLFANVSLLLVPLVVQTLRVTRTSALLDGEPSPVVVSARGGAELDVLLARTPRLRTTS